MVAVTMPKGLKVSIKFTPQANDDYLYFDEDSGGEGYDYGTDDLLANDDAANAARVWGIFAQSETDVQSNIGTLVSNTQPNGDNAFAIGGVLVSYDAETGDIIFEFDPADFDHLAEGESLEVGAFTYVIRMSNGAFSTAIAHIVVNGSNDAPVITVEDGDSDSKELDETNSGLTTFGTLTVSDVDASDEVSSSVTGVALSGDFGALTEADVLAMLTLEPLTPLAADGELNNLKWVFESGSQAFNFLAATESLTLTYTITSDDGNGGTDTHEVAIIIDGTNDAPVISVGAGDDDDAELDETDAGLTASGFLTVTDLDDSDEVTSTVTDVALSGDTGALVKADVLGMLTLDPLTALAADSGDASNLTWNFASGSQAFDFLAVGESLTLTYTIVSDDGNGGTDTHDVTIKISGTNDDPDITVETGDSDGDELDETDAGLISSGTLTVVDIDTSDEVSSSVTDVVLDGVAGGLTEADVLGFLKVSPSTGLAADVGDSGNLTWTFDSGSEAFDFLEEDEFLTLTYTITSEDGNGGSDTQTVTIKINGTAEAPANLKPAAVDDRWFISENTTAQFTLAALLGNDSDPENDPMTVLAVSTDGGTTWIEDVDNDGIIESGAVKIDLNVDTVTYSTGDVAADTNSTFLYKVADESDSSLFDEGEVKITTVDIAQGGDKNQTINLDLAPYNADSSSYSYIDAGSGNDAITGSQTSINFFGGQGEDTLDVGVFDLDEKVNGGANATNLAGTNLGDVLIFDGSLDLTQAGVSERILEIETLRMTNPVSNDALTLSPQDVIDLGSGTFNPLGTALSQQDAIRVDGDGSDKLVLTGAAGSWSIPVVGSGSGDAIPAGYVLYVHDGSADAGIQEDAYVLVQSAVSVITP